MQVFIPWWCVCMLVSICVWHCCWQFCINARHDNKPTCIHSIDLKWFSIAWDTADTVAQMRYVAYFRIYTYIPAMAWSRNISNVSTWAKHKPKCQFTGKHATWANEDGGFQCITVCVSVYQLKIEKEALKLFYDYCCYNTSTYVRSNADTVQLIFEFHIQCAYYPLLMHGIVCTLCQRTMDAISFCVLDVRI